MRERVLLSAITGFFVCSLLQQTSPSYLVPCRPGLVIVTSSNVHYIPHEDVIAFASLCRVTCRMNLDRLGGGTFDFTVKTNTKKQYDVCLKQCCDE